MSRALAGLVAASLLAGCGDGKSYVLITVDSASPLSMTALEITLTNNGDSSTSRLDRALTLPPAETMYVDFGPQRTGDVQIDLRALDGTTELARASTKVTLKQHGTVEASVRFGGSAGDGGVDGGGGPDLRPRRKLALSAPTTFDGAFRGGSGIAMADLNTDHVLDLVVARPFDQTGVGQVAILLGKGDGTFSSTKTYYSGVGSFGVAVEDLDQDGKLDVLTSDHGGNVQGTNGLSFLRGNGDGTLAASQKIALPNLTGPWGLALADVNADLVQDVVFVGLRCDVWLLLGSKGGGFGPAQSFATGTGQTYCNQVELADVDEDGKIDVLVDIPSNDALPMGAVGLLRGTGSAFAMVEYLAQGISPSRVAARDLDRDGHLDLIAPGNGGLFVARGRGKGIFFPAVSAAPAPGGALAMCDLDGDGGLDAVTAGPDQMVIYLNAGNAAFAPGVASTAPASTRAVGCADLDSDGLDDLVLVGDSGVFAYYNLSM